MEGQMSEMVGSMQTQFKKTSGDLMLFGIKFISGVIIGLTLALIMQEVLGKAEDENLLAFFFVIVVTMAAFMRITRSWGLAAMLIFDLVCVLSGLVLRLYIMVAPGA
jgi:hypothetical protein